MYVENILLNWRKNLADGDDGKDRDEWEWRMDGMCSACLRAIFHRRPVMDGMENASGLGGKECILYTQEFAGMSCVFFLGEKLSLQISSIILSENVSTNVNCCYFTYVHSIKIMSFLIDNRWGCQPVKKRTSAGSSTNLHMLSTILGATLQENFLRAFTYLYIFYYKGISQYFPAEEKNSHMDTNQHVTISSIQGRGLRSLRSSQRNEWTQRSMFFQAGQPGWSGDPRGSQT